MMSNSSSDSLSGSPLEEQGRRMLTAISVAFDYATSLEQGTVSGTVGQMAARSDALLGHLIEEVEQFRQLLKEMLEREGLVEEAKDE
jgi:hypothetical protein